MFSPPVLRLKIPIKKCGNRSTNISPIIVTLLCTQKENMKTRIDIKLLFCEQNFKIIIYRSYHNILFHKIFQMHITFNAIYFIYFTLACVCGGIS